MFDMVPFGRRNRRMLSGIDRDMQAMWNSFFNSNTGMNTDITDEGDHYLLKSDLPGMEKDDIKIDIQGDRLTISAEQTSSRDEDKGEGENRYVYRERSYGSYRRSFNISDIKGDEISARYRNGVLELKLPKKDETKQTEGRTLEIED